MQKSGNHKSQSFCNNYITHFDEEYQNKNVI
jgi:hypothetical protein